MSSIKVAVRCRPLFEPEKPAAGLDIQSRRILLDSKTYDPDFTFAPTATQEDIFVTACRPILQCVKDGLNGTVLVYGQTGTGKTYTMLGDGAADGDSGLVHRVIADMLEHVQARVMDGAQCALTLSMIEIYNERLTDMLSPQGDEEVTLIGGFPRSTSKVTLCRVSDAKAAIERGLAWRHTAATMMNERSSRSHVVFIVDLEQLNAFTNQVDVAHLFLVDLAGSESLKKSQATGTAAGEAGKINKSLLALKNVLLVLSNTNEATRPAHVPYRDSKLTELLQDSIGGSARTLMIACISSVGRDIEETKSTLMYAVKARSIRNAANTEREKLQVRLRSLEVDNQKLRNRLQERVNERGGYYMLKEEYEAHQAMEDEVKELRDNVEQLMRDRQETEAHQHISESQRKVLQSLVEDKEAELQAVKQRHYEALRCFEQQGSALQRLVQSAVARVRGAVEGGTRDSFRRLEEWQSRALERLELPPGTAASSGGGSTATATTAATSTPATAAAVLMPPLAPSRAASPSFVRPSSARDSLASAQGAPPSSTGSPARKGRARRAEAASQPLPPPVALPYANEEGEAEALEGGKDTEREGEGEGEDYLAESDAVVARAVVRINECFATLTQELVASHAHYQAELRAAEEGRRERVAGACEELRSALESGLARIARAERSAQEDLSTAHEAFAGRLRVAAGTNPPGDAAVFHGAIRRACVGATRTARAHFPSPHAAPQLLSLLDQVTSGYQSGLNAVVAGGLTALSSNSFAGTAAPFTTAATAAAGEAVAGPLLLALSQDSAPASPRVVQAGHRSGSPLPPRGGDNNNNNNSNNTGGGSSSSGNVNGSVGANNTGGGRSSGVPGDRRSSLSRLNHNSIGGAGKAGSRNPPYTSSGGGGKRKRSAGGGLPLSARDSVQRARTEPREN